MPGLPSDLRQELELAVEDCCCVLIHLDYQGNLLRVMIENPEETTVSDCERVSRRISPILDVHEFGTRKYLLEVTSPGLDRPLFGPKDYQRFAGRTVKVQWQNEEGKRTDTGVLSDFHAQRDEALRLVDEQDHLLRIPVDAVLNARLEIEL